MRSALGPLVLTATTLALLGCAVPTVASPVAPSHSPVTTVASPVAPSQGPVATATGPVGQSVDVGGRSLYIACQGSGSPTVILEAGMTGDHRTWDRVLPALSGSPRVCAYARANIAPSDAAETPRSAADAVADLHALLETAAITGPYVLVGFSMGGLISQLYAATYPGDIAGLVLVESNHPDEAEEFESHLTPAQIAEDRAATLENPEGFDPFASFEEAQAAGPLPDVPLVVVTAGISAGWPPDWDAALFDSLRAQQQSDLATLIPGGRQIFAPNSGHHVPSEAPEVVVDAIQSVLAEVG